MDEEFEALIDEFFRKAMEREPVAATWLGLHQYDHLLPDRSEEANMEDIRLLKEYKRRFEKLFPEKPENRIDREVALYVIDNQLFELEGIENWRKYPGGPMELGDSLFLLLSRGPARLQAIKGRLERAGEYLEGFKSSVKEPVRLYVEIGLEQASALPSLLDLIKGLLKAKGEDVRAVERAKEEVKEHMEWMKSELLPKAKEEFAIGEEKFKELLKVRRIGLSIEEILEIGEKGMEMEKKRLKELVGGNYLEALNRVKENHPKDHQEVKAFVRKLLEEAKKFIVEKEFATLPEGEELVVEDTPEYLRGIMPFAAYMPPGPFEERLRGIYLVTPMEGDMLKEACYSCLANVLVHEGYPGHHLQLSCAARNRRPIRFLSQAPEMVEGWALYCEEAMKGLGFYADRDGLLIQAVDSLWRAIRVLVDVNLSTGRMGFDEAVDFLQRETGMARRAAEAEVKNYSLRPGYFMSYYIGKIMIKELKEFAKKKWGSGYSERRFHDLLLYQGSLPLSMFKDLI